MIETQRQALDEMRGVLHVCGELSILFTDFWNSSSLYMTGFRFSLDFFNGIKVDYKIPPQQSYDKCLYFGLRQ